VIERRARVIEPYGAVDASMPAVSHRCILDRALGLRWEEAPDASEDGAWRT
jgi:hypothetical protein